MLPGVVQKLFDTRHVGHQAGIFRLDTANHEFVGP
jgi:hypothetical protein